MREIKFRAWIDDNHNLLGYSEDENYNKNKAFMIKLDDGLNIDIPCYISIDEKGVRVTIDDLEDTDLSSDKTHIMQYTGLKDKNGVEIYEGDVVKLYFEDEYSNECCTVDGLSEIIAKIKFDYQGVYAEEYDSTWYYVADLISNEVELEVIGNIYENKELLS